MAGQNPIRTKPSGRPSHPGGRRVFAGGAGEWATFKYPPRRLSHGPSEADLGYGAVNAIEIKFSNRQINLVRRLTVGIPKGFKRIAQGAISRTLTKVKSLTVHILAKAARIKQKSLKRNIFVKRPSFEVLAGYVRFGAGRVPIYEMYARQTKPGVTFQGREGRQLIPHSFIATMPSGHTGVFMREATKRFSWRSKYHKGKEVKAKKHYHIYELPGPSFWFLWETHPEAQEDVRAEAEGELAKQVEDRLKYVLAEYGAGTI